MNKTRIAKCSCGMLQIYLLGDPLTTAVCNCTDCQKRTGSAFGVGAYFNKNQVSKITGQGKLFVDTNDSGRFIKRTFCENCGSTVFWDAEFQPGLVGVAVGCFSDPSFPEPSVAVWNESKLNWVRFPEAWLCLSKQVMPQNPKE